MKLMNIYADDILELMILMVRLGYSKQAGFISIKTMYNDNHHQI